MKYNVGDKVLIQPYEWYLKEIESESWCPNIFDIYWCSREMTISKIEKSYYLMEEDMQEFHWTDEMIEGLVEERMSLDKAGQITDFEYEGLVYTLPEGYQFTDGNVINATKIVLEKKKEYPKTYDECCKVLNYKPDFYDADKYLIYGYMCDKLRSFQKLLVCLDAYWKIAGEEMGLSKPWEPDHKNPDVDLYVIINSYNQVDKAKHGYGFPRHVFSFPTEEMRDAFFENFKSEIEICKELL